MAAPAEPILASALWAAHLTKQPATGSKTVISRCQSIDDALRGGLRYGSMHCISGESGGGVEEFSQALLVTHLLDSRTATATIIDTALSFDVKKLHRIIAARLKDQADAAQQAVKVLDRLKIMKVFDFIGLTESMTELRCALEGRQESDGHSSPAPNATIGDSEDEDEMLDAPTPPPRATALGPSIVPCEARSSQGFLLINSISQVTAPLLKNNHAQGQALLSTFMRSLSHLTKAHDLCTVLLNGVILSTNIRDETPSIFASCTLRPALGKTFTYMLDTHMLVHQVPRTVADARAAYKSTGGGSRYSDLTSVVEVLHDRHDRRLGRWAPFNIGPNGTLEQGR